MKIEKLKYPLGTFETPTSFTNDDIENAIQILQFFPTKIAAAVKDLTNIQLQTPYRPQGWTIAQVVHHCADSHLNAMVRIKLMLTEKKPTIKPYLEDKWATMIDNELPIENSLQLIQCVHHKMVAILQNVLEEQWQATYFHPEYKKEFSLADVLFLYSWHCKHHLAHIMHLKNEKGWS